VSHLMVTIHLPATAATLGKQCQALLSPFSDFAPCDGQTSWSDKGGWPDHAHSLVALRLVYEIPTESLNTVLCFLPLVFWVKEGEDTWNLERCKREDTWLALNPELS
jgi:hypothetical protein